MKTLTLTTMVAALALTGMASARPSTHKVPADRVVLPDRVNPIHYDIDVTPDAAHSVFNGTVRIEVAVSEPTYQIVLNAAELDVRSPQLSPLGSSSAPQNAAASYDVDKQTVTLTFASEIPVGRYSLSMSYSGKINHGAGGLFNIDYDNRGRHQRALFTQFESADARRFVPCWDEPNRKATFTLSVTVPADEMAVSNMPALPAEIAPSQGMKHVRFSPTPKMSTYLLFFGLGDFERKSRNVDGVDVGVIVKRGDLDKASFALDAAAQLLPYYNDYFGTKYPLPKLDLIAGPGAKQFFSAMENWGALFYFERALLVDPRISTQSDKQTVYVDIAHEMAHQWFGDLVTMDWWDDLWLNEGFASWMESKATDHFHPDWHLSLYDMMSKQRAMTIDATAGTHPVIQPIRDVLQSGSSFDSITYAKGEAVIRMLEAYVGEGAFRDGVRNYISKHAYGNTVTDDLWTEIDAVSRLKITDIAHDFTLQSGVPLIRVERQKRPSEDMITLDQDRFGLDDESKSHRRWQVPVVARALDDRKALTFAVVDRIEFGQPGAGPFLINAGQNGYFRTLYHNELFEKLVERFDRLSSVDQMGILNDTGSLANAGYQPEGDLLSLLPRVPVRSDPLVVGAMVRWIDVLDRLEDDLSGQDAFRAYARRRLAPVLAVVGWDPQPGEGDNVANLREATLSSLARCADSSVLAEAQRRFQSYQENPGTLSAAARRIVLQIVAERADAATWNQLHALARAASSPLEKTELYGLLGSARDSKLAAQALDLAFSTEVEAASAAQIISEVGSDHPEMAFNYSLEHLEQLSTRLSQSTRYRFLARLVSGSHDRALAERLRQYAEKNIPTTARASIDQAESAVANTLKTRSEVVPAMDEWLGSHPR
jgi:aminopeptidase N